ncbi:8713_t:CDS:2 [Diversispora eburnea]|uniref:8713_t:CDS:1 n=1 Tax=Diversispora eburnea TaxID=1213867 RepID=A0A9N9F7J4_9GLOM|nr:8713_t:CDS:2 [Diversispora eburnea]
MSVTTTYVPIEDSENVPDVPLVFISNTYLDGLTANMRSLPIPWEGFRSTSLISQEEFELLKQVDQISREHFKTLMNKEAKKYAELFVNILGKFNRVDPQQYVLVLIGDMLSDDEKRTVYFHELSEQNPELPYPDKPLPFNINEFFRWIILKLKSKNPQVNDLTVQILESILRVPVHRLEFWSLIQEKAPEANLPAMLVAKLLNFCENLSARKWSDSEIVEDIEFLKIQLQENFHSLTTFDEYASEIQSGMLQWSPPHESEQFWKQNVNKLNERDRDLLKLLVTSSDNTVLAIGAKQRIMELMTHEDPGVRYQCLIAVQKYMTHAWVV